MNKRRTEDNDIKDLKLVAHIGEVQLIIVAETEDLAHMFITKLESCVTMKKSDIQIDAKLQNISVFDPSPNTIYKHVSTFNIGFVFFFLIILTCIYISISFI